MTQLRYKIEAYLEREVSLQDDVEIEKDENGVETINAWLTNDKVKPTTEQLDALESEAQSLENNKIVRGKRRTEYGSLEDQIHFITENGLDAWQTKVQEIKTKYPKE
jgi:hypothetical protein